MNRRYSFKTIITSVLLGVVAVGCQPQQPKFMRPQGDAQSKYIDEATRIEYPDTCVESLDDVMNALPPLTLDNPDPKEEWLLSLDEVRQMALENSKVLRQISGVNFSANGVNGTPTLLLASPSASVTVWDPAIIESNPTAGVQAALSAFDAVWNSSVSWQKADIGRNYESSYQRTVGTRTDVGSFQTTLSKNVATGGNVYAAANVGYEWSDATNRLWGSDWTSYIEAGFTQPLFRGAGVEYNRIAGPNGTMGNSNGVVIARINTDIALVDFEMGVRKTLQDVEETYWNLYYAYRNLSAAAAGYEAALKSWRTVEAQSRIGRPQGSAQNVAQAEKNYQSFKVSAQEAQNNLYKNEQLLRYMIGIAPTDGRLIKPSDEPTVARVQYIWEEIVAEGLARAPELRKQKWTIKKRELELIAQRNYLKPQVDLQGLYRFHGLGHDLIDSTNKKSNAWGSLTSGEYQNWTLGVTSSVTLGFRREMAAVRNAELALARERAILQEQELELVHNLSDLYRDVERNYHLIEDYLSVLRAARKQVRAVNASFMLNKTTLYEVLQAQQELADAETRYYRTVIDYNLSVVYLNFRKGSLLEYNGVTLAEGPWPNKAYFDSWRHARERDAGRYVNYAFTSPQVVSRGAYPQIQGTDPTVASTTNYATSVLEYTPNVDDVNTNALPVYSNGTTGGQPAILQYN
ncbi:MAG: TolC family protein [Planctomycetia bacterium]|nr:TolC family protein [Planctomycetia bacterium]